MNMQPLPSFVHCTRNFVRIQVSSASRLFSPFADALTSQRAERMCDRESFAGPGMSGISPIVLESQFASFCLRGNTPVGQFVLLLRARSRVVSTTCVARSLAGKWA